MFNKLKKKSYYGDTKDGSGRKSSTNSLDNLHSPRPASPSSPRPDSTIPRISQESDRGAAAVALDRGKIISPLLASPPITGGGQSKSNEELTSRKPPSISTENLGAGSQRGSTASTASDSLPSHSHRTSTFFSKRMSKLVNGAGAIGGDSGASLPPVSSPLAHSGSEAASEELPLSSSSGLSGGSRSRFSMLFSPNAAVATMGSKENLASMSAGSSMSLKRQSKRAEGSSSSASNSEKYGTFRLSRRFLDALGFEDGGGSGIGSNSNDDLSSVVSYGGGVDDVEGDVDFSEVDESVSAIGDSLQLMPVQIYVRDSKSPVIHKIKLNETIGAIIKTFLEEGALDFSEADRDPRDWRICKIDRSSVATRLWLPEDSVAYLLKLRDGDEFRLKNVNDQMSLSFRVPPSNEVLQITYLYDSTVKTVVDSLAEKYISPSSGSYGLYEKKIGLWLDDKKSMVSYEIDPEQIIELRPISQEFLLRVHLPDTDSKFTLKVIPSLCVSDIIAMITYNIKTKRIALEEEVKDFIDIYTPICFDEETVKDLQACRKKTAFGLYRATTNQWLIDTKTLEEYGIVKGQSDDHQPLEYRIRFQPLTVVVPEQSIGGSGKSSSDMLKAYSPAEKKIIRKNMIQIMTSRDTRVKDVCKLLHMDFGQAGVSANDLTQLADPSSGYGLFTRGMDKLKDDDLVWKVLSDNSPLEVFEFKMVPRKCVLISSIDPEAKAEVEFDPSFKVNQLIHVACRRFGLSVDNEFRTLRAVGSAKGLDPKKSLLSNKHTPKDVLLVEAEAVNLATFTPPESIWAEIDDTELNITYANDGSNIVTTATLNKLVEKLTSSDGSTDSSNYMDFLKTFLLTYHSFTTPTIFLQKLIERYSVPRQKTMGITYGEFEKQRLRVQLRIANVLQQWTKKYFYDFVDFVGSEELSRLQDARSKGYQESRKQLKMEKYNFLLQVLDFVERVMVFDHPTVAKQVRKNIFKLCDGSYFTQRLNLRNEVTASEASPIAKFIKPSDPSKLSLFACDSEEIARQLTLIEFDLFLKIMPYEVLNQAWTKKDAAQRAPNVIQITKRFNEVALWIVKSILEVKSVKARAKRFAKLVDIASHLYAQNNFSTLMAFVAGFNKAAVNRLKFTAKEMGTKSLRRFAEMERIMSAEGAYKNYRDRIRNANPPCIPYIGVYLLDLTYIEDGNPDTIKDLINFSKRRLIYTIIREVQVFQDTPPAYRPVEEIVQLLQRSVALPVQEENPLSPVSVSPPQRQPFTTLKEYEEHLFNLSLQREPRGADRSQII